jgi:ligand-binding sensor domain-containing protein
MNGDLWVGTLSGLYQYDDEKESFRHIPFTADKGIDIFQFDKDNKLWILMDGNLIRFNSSVSSLRKTTKATPLFALPAKTVSGSGVRTG